MPALESYDRALTYSYAPGVFPSIECLKRRPTLARRLLIHSRSESNAGVHELREMCGALGIREETADRALRKLSHKDNCYAAVVFDKPTDALDPSRSHVALDRPSDYGNLGTILRSLAGFGFNDLAIFEPAADVFDPRVVRASMGAIFAMRIQSFRDYAAYRAVYPDHAIFPFMLGASRELPELSCVRSPYALIFGNEGEGLPESFIGEGTPVRIPHTGDIDSLNLAVAVSIGAYAFCQAENNTSRRDGL
ncbi:MAG: TrmH family RNA methyltransferase [Oscillospiraceae bacterium]|jgi:TrmH family RNA methyltransferase|nr:TrmH family RNA methyltransferase [Oscillospiraceae bacterium]